jgi:uncharacterized protein
VATPGNAETARTQEAIMRETVAVSRFHPGELAVQRRAGVAREAARLEGMLRPAQLDGGAAGFLAQRRFVVITGRDNAGRLWASPLCGDPGFLAAHDTTLTIHTTPPVGDPLHDLPTGQFVGTIAVEFALRRRIRVNGTLVARSADGLTINAAEAFGNCPTYIQQRHLTVDPHTDTTTATHPVDRHTTWSTTQTALIRSADTFFLGTAHPTRGTDVSHRGGRPGFVRIDGTDIWWPDYPGNNMFNSMGNIAANPEAALLFINFTTGETLRLSGTATLEWSAPGGRGDDGDTGRAVRFRPTHAAGGTHLPLRSADVEGSPHNPPLRTRVS